MSDKRTIHGIWLIERQTGRNIVSRAYSGIEIDMDLIAPFLSATHTFIDKASHENLRIIDTENSRYVWQENEHLLFVEPQFFILDVVELVVDDEGSDDQDYGGHELKNHQSSSDELGLCARPHLALQDVGRPKSGDEKSRVATGKETSQESH